MGESAVKIETLLESLLAYTLRTGLAEPEDQQVLLNRLLDLLKIDDFQESQEELCEDLEMILQGILAYACEHGLCEDHVNARDLFDSRIMGAIMPMPREIIWTFREKYRKDPQDATNWYYQLSCDSDYIRRYRIEKDMHWTYESAYGCLDISINLAKPEKDPKAIAAARFSKASSYPKCQLCRENEGYAGRADHPGRSNHRIIPIDVCGEDWYFQYSPYVYYNEHCIFLNESHVPMVIDKAVFEKLLDIVKKFPHYFVGSNADLPIVGGSILSHEHFQGGRASFAIERAALVSEITFTGFADVRAGILNWPISTIRLSGAEPLRLVELADKILMTWRHYSDVQAGILACSNGQEHNTITPIARKRGDLYELDLLLRCNITSPEHPFGVFHAHADKHHIKKENIGLIEAMGLAVLPSRLHHELHALKAALLNEAVISYDGELAHHLSWVEELKAKYSFHEDNTMDILLKEVGHVFEEVLEDCGVFKCSPKGLEQFLRFIDAVNSDN